MKQDKTKGKEALNAIITKIQDLISDYEPRINKLQALADETRDINTKTPTAKGLDLEDKLLGDLIQARTEYHDKLSALMAEFEGATDQLFLADIVSIGGYYKAAQSKDVHDVLLMAWQPKRAILTEFKKQRIMVSKLDLGAGETLKTYWFGGLPKQEGIMLPQFIRKLWTQNPGSATIRFNVRDYMDLRELKNSTRTTENIIAECFRLAKTYFSFELEGRELRGFSMVETHRLENGEMEITLSKGLRELLIDCGRQFHQYPDPLFQINLNDNPHAWEMGMYISDRKSMLWKWWDGTSAKFTTEELWNSTTLPTEEEVKASMGSQYVKEIIRKFERDMNALANVIDWKYEPRGGKEWTRGWKEWKKASVRITWKNNPYDKMDKKAAQEWERKKRQALDLKKRQTTKRIERKK